jgi:signal transduction histidine kinase/CheY-like chemotaxis protein
MGMGLTAGLVGALDAIGDWGLLSTDADLIITGWNQWLERHGGGAAAEIVGRPLFDVYPDLVTRKFDSSFRQALEGRIVILSQRLHRYLLRLPAPMPGTGFDCMQQTARIIPLVEGGKVCGTLTVVEDATERVAHEAELRQRVDALRESDHRKDEFLAMLAHELRSPLAPISNAVQLLGVSPDLTLQAARDIIKRQVAHLARLVDDLLDVSRVSSGKINLQKSPCDLALVAQNAVETTKPFIDSRRHALHVTLPTQPLRVDGDFTRLSQMVGNLLHNAAKYTDAGGEIWLTVEKGAGNADHCREGVIRVRDTGRGISPHVIKNLFELFYQADQNLDRAEGGLGIGLSLVKRLVEMHGGAVEADSAGQGKGSEFTIRLPLLTGEPALAQEDVALPPIRSAGLRILVVDDNLDSAQSMAMLLRLDGHEVLTAHDGKKAVEMALRERPAVVLLDIGLPHLDGYQACRAIRDGGVKDALIVAMTGYGQDEDRRRSRESSFDAHLVKPVDLEALRKLLARKDLSRA